MNKIKILLFFILLSCTQIILSQKIETDRPDQTEASSLVFKKSLQVETGAFFESFGAIDATTYNTTLIRYGLLDNLELRLGIDNSEIKLNSNTIASGFSPLLVGVKIKVTEEKGILPEIAFIGHINFHSFASSDFKTKRTGTDFRFSLSHTLSEKSSLGYNIGMAWDGDVTTAIYVYTIAYGYSFTDKIGGYVEIYGDAYEDDSFNHLWDMGLTYLINENVQLDISGGTGITQNVQDLFLSAGISIRIPE
jgi:hypothetical protein